MSIQVGIELEFMVAHPTKRAKLSKKQLKDKRWPESKGKPEAADPENWVSCEKSQAACVYQVCVALRDAGVPVASLLLDNTTDATQSTLSQGGTVEQFGRSWYSVWNANKIVHGSPDLLYSYWVITPEEVVTHHTRAIPVKKRSRAVRGYEWYAVEISSPIISDSEHFQNQLPTVQNVVDSLKCSTKIWVNSGCGLHIHASPSHHELGLVQAKRVATVTYVLEQTVLFGSCHPCRKFSSYCKPISMMSRIALGHYGNMQEDGYDRKAVVAAMGLVRENYSAKMVHNEPAIFTAINAILACADMEALSEGLGIPTGKSKEDGSPGPSSRGALAISKFGTMEFRYPECSFDIDFIIFWTKLVRRIFAISSLEPDLFVRKLMQLYKLAITKEPQDIVEWLDVLDLLPWVTFLRTRRTNYRTILKNWILPV